MPLNNITTCFRQTLSRLRTGSNLSRIAIQQLSTSSRDLCEEVVNAYDAEVATGEVGQGGNGRASTAVPTGICPTGLLYGRVQSGKTNAMIMTAAAAVDNGFKIIIVLTSDITDLVNQTLRRFGNVSGPVLYHTNNRTSWVRDRARMRSFLPSPGLIFICAKNGHHLWHLISTLNAIGASDYPALIIDDEADQATLDTSLAARTLGRPSAPAFASRINRLTIENTNPLEVGVSLREHSRHNVLLQVTATPNALFLQNSNSPSKPSFVRLLEPGPGYCGGDRFFSSAHVGIAAQPPVAYINEGENDLICTGTLPPPGLRQAALYFLVAATAYLQTADFVAGGMKCLVHTSPRQDNHAEVTSSITQLLIDMPRNRATYLPELREAYRDLCRTLHRPPAFRSLMRALWTQLPRCGVVEVNAKTSYSNGGFANEYNFVVGGNVLGRGLTIDNLITTYYTRRPVTAQMDTMLQHARMFGYRNHLMPYTRVFLPSSLAARFRQIHESEEALRMLVSTPGYDVNVLAAPNLRPTRAGVLDPTSILTYRGGSQIYPVSPLYTGQAVAAVVANLDRTVLQRYPAQASRLIQVDVAEVERIVRLIPERTGDTGAWKRTQILAALETVKNSPNVPHGNVAYLWYRTAPERRGTELSQGMAGDREVTAARRSNSTVLMLFRSPGDRQYNWAGVPFWYPTLMLPSGKIVICNTH